MNDITYIVKPGADISGEPPIPGDKSISHRSVILGALADGTSRISRLLEGFDVLAAITAFRQMGVEMEGPTEGELLIHGRGLKGLRAPDGPLDLGNSGTAMRLMAGIMVGQNFGSKLVGDASLSSRPMARITDPLSKMGAHIEASAGQTPPLSIKPSGELAGINYQLPVASAQVKSAILLAGMYAQGKTCVSESVTTRDHTERMLAGFRYPCERFDTGICLQGGGILRATDIQIPADLSSAAFFLVAGALSETGTIRLRNVGVNPTRTGILEILRLMGAVIDVSAMSEVCGEPVADIVIRPSELKGIDIPEHLVPLAIDEFPIICIAAACANGRTTVRGALELRHKESDRIAVMVRGLHQIGVDARELEDGMEIDGGVIRGGCVDSAGDHRVAMAFCIGAIRSQSGIEVRNCANIQTSFPGFLETAVNCGIRVQDAS